jgi:hypothetical protein
VLKQKSCNDRKRGNYGSAKSEEIYG